MLLLNMFSGENLAHGLVIALVRGLQGLYLGGVVVWKIMCDLREDSLATGDIKVVSCPGCKAWVKKGF